MICRIQGVTLGEDGHEKTRELACLERTDVKPETLGLTLAKGKRILKHLQQVDLLQMAEGALLHTLNAPPALPSRRNAIGGGSSPRRNSAHGFSSLRPP